MTHTHFRVPKFVALVSVLAAFGSGASFATPNVAWFPYANCHNTLFSGGQAMGASPTWAGSTSPFYTQIDSASDNLMWSKSRVFSNYPTSTESWYDIADSEYTFIVSLNNPTAASISLQIALFGDGGTQANESTLWGDGTTYLIKQTGNTNLTWNTTYDRFELTLAAGKTVNIPCFDGGTDNFFNMPPASAVNGRHSSIRVVAPNGEDFLASIRGQNFGRYRISTGNSSSSFSTEKVAMLQLGYPAVYLSPYVSGGPNTLKLPVFRESYSTTASIAEWATMVRVVNASDSADDIDVDVYDLDGNLIKSHTFSNVAAHAAQSFSPSQFFTSSSQSQGSIVITGTMPVASAWNHRFPKSTSTYAGYNSRITSMQSAEFFLN